MKIPVPFLKSPAGLGDAVKAATTAVGIKPCGGCSKRAQALNAVTFVPAGKTALSPARVGESYAATVGPVIGGRIPPGLRMDPSTNQLSGIPTLAGRYTMITKDRPYILQVL